MSKAVALIGVQRARWVARWVGLGGNTNQNAQNSGLRVCLEGLLEITATRPWPMLYVRSRPVVGWVGWTRP